MLWDEYYTEVPAVAYGIAVRLVKLCWIAHAGHLVSKRAPSSGSESGAQMPHETKKAEERATSTTVKIQPTV
jgi:hypothetical protein